MPVQPKCALGRRLGTLSASGASSPQLDDAAEALESVQLSHAARPGRRPREEPVDRCERIEPPQQTRQVAGRAEPSGHGHRTELVDVRWAAGHGSRCRRRYAGAGCRRGCRGRPTASRGSRSAGRASTPCSHAAVRSTTTAWLGVTRATAETRRRKESGTCAATNTPRRSGLTQPARRRACAGSAAGTPRVGERGREGTIDREGRGRIQEDGVPAPGRWREARTRPCPNRVSSLVIHRRDSAPPVHARGSARSVPCSARKCPVTCRSEDDLAGLAAGAQEGDGLVEDVGGLGLRATLLHVGEVRLVGLDLRAPGAGSRCPGWPGGRTWGSPTTRARWPRWRTSPPSGGRGCRSR